LPVWVAAAAKAAVRALLQERFEPDQALWIPERTEPMVVPVVSSALLDAGRSALAISHCDPGEGLDLTRGLEIWVTARWRDTAEPPIALLGGAGIGRYAAGGELCVSSFARRLLQLNLESLLPAGRGVELEVVLPRGRELAERTSNAAFGVVDGLALIGLQAEVQRSAAPDQLDQVLDQVKRLATDHDFAGRLTLVIGENGLDLARQAGFEPRIKVGNWMGPVLVAAAEAGVQDLLLLGYHGKLVKLAGGIFHTHHHLADARQEVLMALGLDADLTRPQLQQLRSAASVDGALSALESEDPAAATRLWDRLAEAVEQRSAVYVARYGRWSMRIGVALFDRSRQLRRWGPTAAERFFTLKD
jgi:cobalt-precorrin-5B (C1)-methyltransferase